MLCCCMDIGPLGTCAATLACMPVCTAPFQLQPLCCIQQLLQQQPCDCLSLASLCLAHAAADAAHMQAAAAADSFDGSTTVCCLAIPADMSVAHFCSFIGAYLSEVRAIQVSRFKDTSLPTPSPRLNPRYSALIRLPSHYTKQTACLPQSCEHPSSASLLLLLSCNHKYIVVYTSAGAAPRGRAAQRVHGAAELCGAAAGGQLPRGLPRAALLKPGARHTVQVRAAH